jgi:protein gp37
MSERTEISWTDATWNVARGCDKVSEGCKFCYMMRDGEKFGYNGMELQRTKTVFNFPLKYREKESKVWGGRPLLFTSSLTDFFHPKIDGFRDECWEIIRKCPHLIFQILTKRPERIKDCLPSDWGKGYENVWLGVSVENQQRYDERVPILIETPAKLRFLSIEPMLGPVSLQSLLPVIDWVIVGGESGNDVGEYRYRPMELYWVEFLIQECKYNCVPVFIKQTGTYLSKSLGLKDRHGRNIDEWPTSIRLRQFPDL